VFAGFISADFRYFEQPPAARSEAGREAVRARFTAFCEAVEAALGVARRQLGQPRVQPLRGDDPQAAAQWPGGPRSVNLTVELGPRDVQVDVVGWKDLQAQTMRLWIDTPRAASWLSAHPELELVVWSRSPRNRFIRDGVEHPVWQSEIKTELDERIPAPELTKARLEKVVRQLGDPKWEKPGFHLRRPWPRNEAIRLREALADEVARTLVELAPVVADINCR
jgi:hypothetical protein